MIPLAEAQDYVLNKISRLQAAQIPLLEASGLVTAEPAVSPEPVPAWDNTAMDGFAVLSGDTADASSETPVALEVVGTIAAGALPPDAPKVAAGKAVRIMTGAPIPEGADAVVQVEHAEPWDNGQGGSGEGDSGPGDSEEGDSEPGDSGLEDEKQRGSREGDSELGDSGLEDEKQEGNRQGGKKQDTPISEATAIRLSQPVPSGTHIRRAGEDLKAGQTAVPANTALSPAHLGVLASIGVQEVAAYPRPKVAIFSTGDELVSGGGPLAVGQIRDSNRHSLLALLQDCAEPIDGGVVPDDKAAIEEAFSRYVAECDAVITTGGVSMGDFDYVKVVLDRLGDMRWMQIAIRPAKPLAFGTIGSTPIFGLPGNPVSCMVSFELFARPALRKMAGQAELHRRRVSAIAAEPLHRRPDGKTHFARVRWHWHESNKASGTGGESGSYIVSSAGGQGSHQLSAMADANGLAVLPDGDGIPEGGKVDLILLRE